MRPVAVSRLCPTSPAPGLTDGVNETGPRHDPSRASLVILDRLAGALEAAQAGRPLDRGGPASITNRAARTAGG
jgi:hypothetical protein